MILSLLVRNNYFYLFINQDHALLLLGCNNYFIYLFINRDHNIIFIRT